MAKRRAFLTVLGRQGAGKTHLIRTRILPELPRPVFVLDTMAEFEGGAEFDSVQALARHLHARGGSPDGVFVLKATSKEECAAFFDMLATMGKASIRTGAEMQFSVLIDEASKFCTPRKIDPGVEKLINYGRHYGANLIFAARRAAELHVDVRAQADAIISFQQTEPRDISKLKRSFEIAEVLPRLDYAAHEYAVLTRVSDYPFADVLTPVELSSMRD